jgi:hypothetical protein
MDHLSNIFKERAALEKRTAASIRSERDELIQNFLGHGIKLRDPKTKELRPATAAELAIILRHCPTKDLYPFFRECEGARSFSRFFWWSVKGGKPNIKDSPTSGR